MAIGARPGSVLAMVLRQGFALAAVGLAIGGVLAAGLAVTLSGLLYGITPADPAAWSLAVMTPAGRRPGQPGPRPPRDARGADARPDGEAFRPPARTYRKLPKACEGLQ